MIETIEPSYNTFLNLLPAEIVASAVTEVPKTEFVPVKKNISLAPVIAAKSVYAIDLGTNYPLFAKDIFTRRSIASISKLMTAMVILDENKMDEVVTVSSNASRQEKVTIDLRPGEKITVQSLLTGMLINSGNDAAVALAEHNAGTEAKFVEKMNRKALLLGLKNTHFSNAKGFDDPKNFSTAYDTVIFSQAALKYPFIKNNVAKKTAEISSANGKIKHYLKSTNELLDDPYFKIHGLKTGSTPAAGQSFVSLAATEQNHEILAVVLGSPDRFKETKILIDWVLRNYVFDLN